MPSTDDHIRTGRIGEDLAAAHLRRDGVRVLDRNWRCRQGELDIIASYGATMVFCEVKTRRCLRFGTPMQAIDRAKARRIKLLARMWSRDRRSLGRPRRYDVICVVISDNGIATIDHRLGVL